jgi:hypothetical protein
MMRRVEGVELSLEGLSALPGLVNAHDHLEFALFPRLGRGPYANAREWAADIYRPEQSPIREHLAVPKPLRLLWGGLRNLLSGATTVCHHNPYDPAFDAGFPVRVVKDYGWAHSLAFSGAEALAAPPHAPFLIHLAEGTDEESAGEIFRLERAGALDNRTVLIHAVGLSEEGWRLVAQASAAVVWCPQSNLFTLGRTLDLASIPSGIPVALGADSPLTSQGDLLDELSAAAALAQCSVSELCPIVTGVARAILRLPPHPDDWIAAPEFGEPPELVVLRGSIALISESLAQQLPAGLRHEFYPLRLQGRPPVLVRWNVPELIEATRSHLGELPLTLGGRQVLP